ncbi:MAG: ribosomal L7Ae/L30e/S12e/Gadd45 family protein [Clostridia bacterium]|nr:ribosomal L7Ae/L30e/S12e/Gadd45 family protein [Clostridia bacterium]
MPLPDYLTLLGLAMRAGKVVYGEESVKEAFFTRHVALLVLSSDAGPRTAEAFRRLAERNGVRLLTLPDSKQDLGHAIGKGLCAVAAVTNKGFAESIAAKAGNHIGGVRI